MKVVILGAGGQLGGELARLLPEAHAYTRQELSIVDAGALAAAIEKAEPEVVFNAAAYNAVDRAESEPAVAMAVNSEGPGQLARLCARAGVRLVHFSTNYVFDGRSEHPPTESDPTNPLSTYARSKLAGELAVREALPEALVIRTAAVFAVGGSAIKGGSFPERMLARARGGQTARVVDDQTVNPTYAADLAEASVAHAREGRQGVLHVVGGGCCTYHQFAREILGLEGLGSMLEAVSTGELAAAAPRPRNGCLGSELVPPLRHWREALSDFYAVLKARSTVDRQPM